MFNQKEPGHKTFNIRDKQMLIIITTTIASAAVFFLAIHKGTPKPFDVLTTILAIIALCQRKTRDDLRALWPKIKPYAISIILVLFFIFLGTILNFQENIEHMGINGIFTNFARVAFNGAVFLFFAFLVSSRDKLLPWISIALIASFALAVPAYWDFGPEKFISGGRLMGLTQNPHILGLLSITGFLVMLGLFIEAKKGWQKAVLAGWMVVVANFNLWAASRATWIAISVGLALWVIFSSKSNLDKLKYFIILPAAAFFLGWMLLPSSPTLEIRNWVGQRAVNFVSSPLDGQEQTQTWPSIPKTILGHPAGFGFERPSSSYGTFFEVALFGGVGAVIFFTLFIIRFLKGMRKFVLGLPRAYDRLVDLKLAWIITGVAIVIGIFFTDAFLWRQTWALLGISLGAAWSVTKNNGARI